MGGSAGGTGRSLLAALSSVETAPVRLIVTQRLDMSAKLLNSESFTSRLMMRFPEGAATGGVCGMMTLNSVQ